ncbi:MAG: TetR/AcrR family transcriptional regulator [Cellvibrionaceae bacterium]|nr:TetR/AcrR family transcriptional regulator [Cellvibrionaceae bacterium]MCV6625469.1 TetR/AcrR family transcriptional regulator [Cellvibrionaceae bacterium]
MPRPQSFKREAVLNKAMLLFWQRGYLATSVQDLQAATGLGPGSLYNSFGSKDAIFVEALETYVERVVKGRCERYLRPELGLDGLLHYLISTRVEDNADWGCLLINSAQLRELPTAATACLQRGQATVRRYLLALLQRAEAEGELAGHWQLPLLVSQLEIFTRGLLLQGQLGQAPKAGEIKAMFQQVLNTEAGDGSQ